MSQDIVSDGLNQIMNAVKAGKNSVQLKHSSRMLISILALAKLREYIKHYKLEGSILTVEVGRLNGCRAIKPKYMVKVEDFEEYVKRYLPAKDLGIIIVSTSQGLMTHHTAQQKNLGGSLIAYFY
ncbi:30S ribosomal protein S8 [Candidatus Pacearchaeota archaeon]|nr:30S ribosomal protein S8 [Candidatus Pacearchaeota archaeon]